MAIFNEGYFIDEYDDYDNDILDEMVDACDDMLDEIDDIIYEHGGARNRYLRMLADKDKMVNKKLDGISRVGDGGNAHRAMFNKYQTKKENIHSDIDRYLNNSKGIPGPQTKFDRASGKSAANRIRDSRNSARNNEYFTVTSDNGEKWNLDSRYASREGRKAFNRDFGGPHEDEFSERARKRAVKETCLAILDELDEI